ncbi:6227_t:CDS:2 [Entrophospora sp. SA101]|nr:10025_t:CDS:2 [Entrophospora sp. SA101]CAJ0899615.1 4574_t:CDS:2 [Entrophospora sp. SA101]CAJ0902318.1 913_t:CDS:2 [Entrophospora sp. SA101]CAJ0913911.1 6227_t:CDS:2 [Entrophospora sp. SA101]
MNWHKNRIRNYIKDLRDGPKKEETIISHLWQEVIIRAEQLYPIQSICKIYSELLTKISETNEDFREALYKLVTRSHKCNLGTTILERYILSYNLEIEYF